MFRDLLTRANGGRAPAIHLDADHSPRLPVWLLSGNAPHLHILAATRALTAHGFGATAAALVGDRARGFFVRFCVEGA